MSLTRVLWSGGPRFPAPLHSLEPHPIACPNRRRDMSLPDGGARHNPHAPRLLEKSKAEEDSDEDLFTVPDVESGPSSSGKAPEIKESASSGHGDGPPKQRRGRNPADREYRRLKRLLRNRVSAQQARERKKVYVNDMESRAKELYDKNLKLEEKISTLINENTMLRKVLMNTRPKVDDSAELKNDQSDNS